MFGSREGGAITRLQSQFFNKTEHNKTILQYYPYQKLNFVTLGSSLRTVKEAQRWKFQPLVVEAVMASSQACTFSGRAHSPNHTFGPQCFFFPLLCCSPWVLSTSHLPACHSVAFYPSQHLATHSGREGRTAQSFGAPAAVAVADLKKQTQEKKRKKKKPINIE